MRQVLKGSTNVSVDVYIIDSTDGTPELGVLWNTAGMDMEYRREGAAVVNITEVTLAALTTAHTDGGFLEIGHGLYRLDVPDEAFATGAETVSIQGTVTGMIVLPQTIQLVDFDPEDGDGLGLSRVDAAITTRLAPTTAGRTLDVTATGAAGVDWGNVENQATVVDLSATDIQLCDTVTTLTGHTAQTGDSFARIGATGSGLTSVAQASVCTESRLAELDNANMPTDLTNIEADTQNIQGRLPATLLTGTADSGTTTTMVDAALTEADTDYWVGQLVRFTSGNISRQCRLITAFDPGTDTITFAPATTQAVGTNTYEILPFGSVDVQEWLGNAVTAGVGNRPAVDAEGISGSTVAADNVEANIGNLDVAVSTRSDFNEATDNVTIAADGLTAASISDDAGHELADQLLARDINGGGDAGRSVTSALRALRNRRAIAAGTLTVYQEDDLSPAWTGAVTTTAGDPISEINPA